MRKYFLKIKVKGDFLFLKDKILNQWLTRQLFLNLWKNIQIMVDLNVGIKVLQ